jgi:hypothetical protein
MMPKMAPESWTRLKGIYEHHSKEKFPEKEPDEPCCHYPNPLTNDTAFRELLEAVTAKFPIVITNYAGFFYITNEMPETEIQPHKTQAARGKDLRQALVDFAVKLASGI